MSEPDSLRNMGIEQKITPLTTFLFEGKEQRVIFKETIQVPDTVGVECDVYAFEGDQSKDLGIIRIQPHCKTPLQKVLKGDRTVEGYISGKGKLTITKSDGEQETYVADGESKEPIVVSVEIGELMQWEADKENGLVAYEICFPPYEDGRYENLK
jgi:hypothetical protein